jgi:hypothetical protein
VGWFVERSGILRVRFISKQIIVAALLSFLLIPAFAAPATSPEESAKALPDKLGDFRAQGAAQPVLAALTIRNPEDYGIVNSVERAYRSASGEKFIVALFKTRSDSNAYALLTSMALRSRGSDSSQVVKSGDAGTAGFIAPKSVMFFKGATCVGINGTGKAEGNVEAMLALARNLAETLQTDENEIPALVKHLPDWETARERAVFAVSAHALQEAVGNLPALEAIDFNGGTEAVAASYGSAQLLIIEFGTPQLSIENDARIAARLKELRDAGQPVPTAYRRVGNYSVFVYGAQDEKSAEQLIDRITYEKVVQWLGDNPRAWDRAMKEYNETTSGLIVGVIRASGISALLCLAVGGLFGGLVFMRRRAQQAATEKYSDAGGMLRLNMDELTPQTDPSRLLEKGDG